MIMDRRVWRSGAIGLGLLLAASAGAATAGDIFQTATYTGADTGDYILSSNDFIGAAFTLTGATHITGIGAQFGDAFNPNPGTIFGAIVPLSALDAFPSVTSDQLESIAVAHVVFSAPNPGDREVSLSADLGPGAYALIFGAGLFGSDVNGFAALGDLNDTVGDPTLIRSFFSPDWDSFDDTGVRLFVAVPEPAAWSLMLLGFGGMGALLRRRKAAFAAA